MRASSRSLVRVPPRRLFSRHCVLDEDGWIGHVTLCDGSIRFRVEHRWSGQVALDRTFVRGCRQYQELVLNWRSDVAKWVKRFQGAEREALVGGKAADAALADRFPALHEHLTLDWLEGQTRQPSTVTLSIDGGRWRGCLRDRDNGMVAFVTADGFDDVLGALERGLEDGTLDWRVDAYSGKGAGGRKKR